MFCSFGGFTITGKGLQKSDLSWILMTFERGGTLDENNVLFLNWTRFSGRIRLINTSSLYLIEVRPLFTLSHRLSDNSPLLIELSANYIDQFNRNFMRLKVLRKFLPFDLSRLHARGDMKT